MLIYKLLFSLGIEYDGEIVEALDHSFQLKAVGQVDGHCNMLFSNLVQKYILQINIRLVHPKILLKPYVMSGKLYWTLACTKL